MNQDTSEVAGAGPIRRGSGGSLTRNVAVSSANYLILLAVAFVLLPLMVHRLGVQRYGIWMLAGEFTSYFGYLDFGIRNAVTYYVAMYTAQRSPRQLNEVAASAFWFAAFLGLLLGAGGWGLTRVFPLLFDMTGQDLPEIRRAVILLTLSVAISLPVEVLNSILNGSRRIDISGAIDTMARVAGAIATIVCLLTGRSLVALGIIQVAVKLVCLVSAWIAVRRMLPGLSFNPVKYGRYECLRRLAGFGIPLLLINFGRLVIARADIVMVGMLLGVRAAALYSIPRNLMEYAFNGVMSISISCSAHFTHIFAEKRTADLMALYSKAARISGVVVFLLTAWIAAFGHDFLALWQGPDFVSGPWTQRADVALLILVAAFLPRMLASMTVQLFIATRRLSFVVRTNGLEAVGKIALGLWLIRSQGLAGAALANLIPMAIFEGIGVAGYLFRTFPIRPGAFVGEVLGRPLAVGVVAWAASFGLIAARRPSSWPVFLAEASVAALVGLSAALVIGISGDERRTALARIRNIGDG